jgi:hypothetical protein
MESGENISMEEEKNLFGQTSNKNDRKTFVAGVAYTLPMLFVAMEELTAMVNSVFS